MDMDTNEPFLETMVDMFRAQKKANIKMKVMFVESSGEGRRESRDERRAGQREIRSRKSVHSKKTTKKQTDSQNKELVVVNFLKKPPD